ncbi:MAG TPA: cupin domain-containing protein [Actinomycetota bacterium]|nr:cupin domain-containing protein [Actinomycetota bacterium]
MRVSAGSEGTFVRGDVVRFTGEVWLRSTLRDEEGNNVGVVHFSPGARTNWHRHPGGQFLYAVAGRGRVRSGGEVGRTLEPGDVIHVEPGEWHFHGATPDAPLVHVAVNRGGDAEWGPPVTDEEYAETFGR